MAPGNLPDDVPPVRRSRWRAAGRRASPWTVLGWLAVAVALVAAGWLLFAGITGHEGADLPGARSTDPLMTVGHDGSTSLVVAPRDRVPLARQPVERGSRRPGEVSGRAPSASRVRTERTRGPAMGRPGVFARARRQVRSAGSVVGAGGPGARLRALEDGLRRIEGGGRVADAVRRHRADLLRVALDPVARRALEEAAAPFVAPGPAGGSPGRVLGDDDVQRCRVALMEVVARHPALEPVAAEAEPLLDRLVGRSLDHLLAAA